MTAEPLRILIADDVEDTVSTLAKLLAQTSYVVETSTSGQQALRLAEDFRPDCVMLDVCMPDGGAALTQQFRERYGSSLVLIGMSGLDESDPRYVAMRVQVDYMIAKPIDIVRLGQVLSP